MLSLWFIWQLVLHQTQSDFMIWCNFLLRLTLMPTHFHSQLQHTSFTVESCFETQLGHGSNTLCSFTVNLSIVLWMMADFMIWCNFLLRLTSMSTHFHPQFKHTSFTVKSCFETKFGHGSIHTSISNTLELIHSLSINPILYDDLYK